MVPPIETSRVSESTSGRMCELTAFDLPLARLCVAACRASYVQTSTIAIERTDTQVIIQKVEGYVIVAFRGTTNLRDWLTDLKFRFKSFDAELPAAGKVHRGFRDAVNSAIGEIKIALEDFSGQLVITGHSLGGADAILTAWMLAYQDHPIHAVYTFGQPRVGNGGFARAYDAELRGRTFRLVYEADIVPRLPGVLMGYRHCGTEIFLPAFGSNLKVNPSLLTKLASDAVGAWRAWKANNVLGFDNAIRDHAISNYINRLNSLT